MHARQEAVLRVVLRVAILVTAIAEVMQGDVLYGTFCFVALLLTLVPMFHARRADAGIPVALELVLLWFMVADMTLGNWLGLYHLTWYDKAIHLSDSLLVSTIGFLVIYVLHLTHRTRFRFWLDALTILLVTLGIGAVWEIAEYGVDQLLAIRTQGSPGLSPIDDTMFDLILDAVGGIAGSVLGTIYIVHARRKHRIIDSLTGLLQREEEAPRPSAVQ
ncbi:hypothetical protein BH11MYX2_BH11MYX2_10080 [soil metagenome]